MKILVLSYYFPPDLSAGSFRVKALVEALVENGPPDLDILVITTYPNRYGSFTEEVPDEEAVGNITVRRFKVPVHKSGMVDQAKGFLTFSFKAFMETRGGKHDLVIATSSRLMTAILGSVIAAYARCKLYLDIRDLFTDTMGDLLAVSPLKIALPFVRWIEKRCFRSADRINVVSGGFLPLMAKIAPNQRCSVFTNGIDDEFLGIRYRAMSTAPNHVPVIFYAGNIGDGQGLEHIVPPAALVLIGKAQFHIVGDGSRCSELQAALALGDVGNVQIEKPIPRHMLLKYYEKSDILFLHLNDKEAFRKVLPSKLFEYAATGKPILAGVSGYAAEFITKEISGAAVFDPCDMEGFITGFQKLRNMPHYFDRTEFCDRFRRSIIMDRMANDIFETAGATP